MKSCLGMWPGWLLWFAGMAGAADWFVAPGGTGPGISPQNPAGRIGEALEHAAPGDRIVVAHGEYRESLTSLRAGVTVAAAEPVPPGPLAPVRVVATEAPVLTARADGSWYGLEFHAAGTDNEAVRIEGASPQFIRCRFSARPRDGVPIDESRALARLAGGTPSFYASSFVGDYAAGIGAVVASDHPTAPRFAYCFFSDLSRAVVVLNGVGESGTATAASLWMANALMVRCGPAVWREAGSAGTAEVVNSVLHLVRDGMAAIAFPPAPPVRFRHCLYAPAPGDFFHFGISARRAAQLTPDAGDHDLPVAPVDRQIGVEAEKVRTGSPRFLGARGAPRVNVAVLGARNAEAARTLAAATERHQVPMTWALDTQDAVEDHWALAEQLLSRGHEVVAHTVNRTPLTGPDPLQVGYAPPDAREVLLSIRPDRERPNGKALTITVDGQPLLAVPLTDVPRLTVGELAAVLREAGVAADLNPAVSPGLAARVLADVDDLDIRVPRARIPLAVDLETLFDLELRGGRTTVARRTGRPCVGLAFPPGSNTAWVREWLAREAAAGDGFRFALDNGMLPFAVGPAAVEAYGLPGFPLARAFGVVNVPDWRDAVEIAFDAAADRGVPLSFHDGGAEEMTAERWGEFFARLGRRLDASIVTLEGMARVTAAARAERPDGERVPSAVTPDESAPSPETRAAWRPASETSLEMYRPAADSPLAGGGIEVGLRVDFAGRAVPADRPPAIGLFE